MDKELHQGHRRRMTEKYSACGADACADHELLEMLLYYSLPRVNTNETAILLLKRFGSLQNVLSASIRELTAIPGIGEKSARLIKLCGDLSRRAQTAELPKRQRFKSIEEIGTFLVGKLDGYRRERVMVLFLSSCNELLDCTELGEGSVNTADVDIRKIMEYAILRKASKLVLAHNHPDGNLSPSDSDVTTTRQLHRACLPLEIELCEHILVADGQYMPIMKYMQQIHLNPPR